MPLPPLLGNLGDYVKSLQALFKTDDSGYAPTKQKNRSVSETDTFKILNTASAAQQKNRPMAETPPPPIARVDSATPPLVPLSNKPRLLRSFTPQRRASGSSDAPQLVPEALVGLSTVNRVNSSTAPEVAPPLPSTRPQSARSSAGSAFSVRSARTFDLPASELDLGPNFKLTGSTIDLYEPLFIVIHRNSPKDLQLRERGKGHLITFHCVHRFRRPRGCTVKIDGDYTVINEQKFSLPTDENLTYTIPSGSYLSIN